MTFKTLINLIFSLTLIMFGGGGGELVGDTNNSV